jgi:hypothetical protein
MAIVIPMYYCNYVTLTAGLQTRKSQSKQKLQWTSTLQNAKLSTTSRRRGLEASEWDDLQYPCYAWLRLLELLDPSAAHLRAQHASPGVDEH